MARKTGSKNCPRPTTPIRISRTMIVCGMGKGKYPPAKPGALGFEPLKAACRPLTLAPVPHSETHATKEYLTLKVPVRRNALSPTPIERRGQGCRVSFFLPSKSSRVHRLLSEMSNCYCHPGKAGGTPKILGVSRATDTGVALNLNVRRRIQCFQVLPIAVKLRLCS